MLTKECRMPDLSELKPTALGCYLAGALVGASQSRTREEDNILKSAARLVDKARFEYIATREAVLDEIKENNLTFPEIEARGQGQFIFAVEVINRLENCINAIARVHNLLSSNSNRQGLVRNFRNSIEHADERIRENTVGPLALDISEDASIIRIFFRDRKTKAEEIISLTTDDLALEITTLHQEVRNLLK